VTRPIIIDADPGQDDAVAILMALASPELEVLGITTVAGNVPQPKVTDNALRLVELAGRADVPVHQGAVRPLVRELFTAEYVHGPTGIDGADLPETTLAPADGSAADFIIDVCRGAADLSLTLCPLGPLTNIALALRRAPEITAEVREIVLMGGAFAESGNVTPAAEFNIFVDPHAARAVFTSGVPITVMPLDVTHKALVMPHHIERLRALGTAVGDSVAGMLGFFVRYDLERYGMGGGPLHDPCVIAYLIEPALFTGKQVAVSVETDSPLSAGLTLADWWGLTDDEPNATVMTGVDADAFMDLVIERIGRL